MAAHDSISPHGPRGAWPVRQDPVTAQLRLTHADRDTVMDQLKEAYAEGQLDEDEFQHRLDLAMGAKVRADIEPLLGDLAVRRPTGNSALSQGEEPPDTADRLWAVGSHLSGYFTLALGPLIVLLVKGGSPYVRRQAMEALNYQLMFLIFSVLLVPIAVLTLGVGLIVYLFMLLGWVILPPVAAVASLIGAEWRYPLTWRAIKDRDDR